MSAANSEVTVCAFVPSLDADKSVRHAIEVRCALDRIRDRSQIDIWTASLNMLDCGFDIFDFLAIVSPPHQQQALVTAADACSRIRSDYTNYNDTGIREL